jgi:hypothetical protein
MEAIPNTNTRYTIVLTREFDNEYTPQQIIDVLNDFIDTEMSEYLAASYGTVDHGDR